MGNLEKSEHQGQECAGGRSQDQVRVWDLIMKYIGRQTTSERPRATYKAGGTQRLEGLDHSQHQEWPKKSFSRGQSRPNTLLPGRGKIWEMTLRNDIGIH